MHLDTVFTQIDYDKFTYHPGIMNTLEVYEITEGDDPTTFEDLNVKKVEGSLEEILENILERKLHLFHVLEEKKYLVKENNGMTEQILFV